MATFPEEGRINELVAVAGAGGVNLYVRLYTNDVTVDKDTTLEMILEATVSSYSPFNSDQWTFPAVEANGDIVMYSPVIVFQGPALFESTLVRGFYVTIGTGLDAKLWLIEAFPAPMPLSMASQQIPLRVTARLRYLPA